MSAASARVILQSFTQLEVGQCVSIPEAMCQEMLRATHWRLALASERRFSSLCLRI